MKIELRLTGGLREHILSDLARPHPFAAERVGFVFGRVGSLATSGKMVLLNRYHAIPDESQYIDDPTVGARIGSDALTWGMQAVYRGRSTREGIFHIHVHPQKGETGMSRTDSSEIPKLMPGFQSVGREAIHGIIILSLDHGSAWVWVPGRKEPVAVSTVSVIGKPIEIFERRAVK